MAVAVLVVGAVLIPPAGSAGAARPAASPGSADTRTHCTFTSAITLTPGLSIVPSSGTFTSGGETGTVSCDGPVRGIVPTGPGTLGVEGRYTFYGDNNFNVGTLAGVPVTDRLNLNTAEVMGKLNFHF